MFIEGVGINGGCQGLGEGETSRYQSKGTKIQVSKMSSFWKATVQHRAYNYSAVTMYKNLLRD